jgi:hypothetical protein
VSTRLDPTVLVDEPTRKGIELYDPGNAPVITWRAPAARRIPASPACTAD